MYTPGDFWSRRPDICPVCPVKNFPTGQLPAETETFWQLHGGDCFQLPAENFGGHRATGQLHGEDFGGHRVTGTGCELSHSEENVDELVERL